MLIVESGVIDSRRSFRAQRLTLHFDKGADFLDETSTAKYKSRRFAIRIVRLYQYLCREKKEYVLSKQILCCGTSIGANIAESECAISKKDFLSKIYIALKECNETLYWLDLLHETDYLTSEEFFSIKTDCEEIRKILSSTTKTIQSRGKADE